ncbi:MAG TPA: CmcI family methyltransferase, partial [Candidatus Hodarchaeales archaeon]|nr:CmcI family methyltransferase [Candidatus Hodarchaeales archaeon]
MARKIRIGLLCIGIVALLAENWFRPFLNAFDNLAVRRIQALMDARREYLNYWLGVRLLQNPEDMITYEELIYSVKPETIIETGTYHGGLALFLATVIGKVSPHGKVVTVDIDSSGWDEELKAGRITPESLERIVFIKGSSTNDSVIRQVAQYAENKTCLVILDSDHHREHVFRELQLYTKFVSKGSYVIVNDTDWPPLNKISGKGPMAAINDFMSSSSGFMIDPGLPRHIYS